MKVQTFVRSWWRKDHNGKYVPHMGRKSNIEYCNSIEDARTRCQKYNDNITGSNPTGRKMEFTTNF